MKWKKQSCRHNDYAKCGYLSLIRWDECSTLSTFTSLCREAACNGHIHVLEWARQQGGLKSEGHRGNDAEERWNVDICGFAASGRQLHVAKWARRLHCSWGCYMINAARHGFIELLLWGFNNSVELDSSICEWAARGGSLGALQLARKFNCPWDVWTCITAAKYGHLHVLKWAVSQKCPWDNRVCSKAAKYGRLEMIQWAHLNGCPWDIQTTYMAATYGQTEIFKFAVLNGCKWKRAHVLQIASHYGYQDIIDWILNEIGVM